MRQIKFRKWDFENNEMIDGDSLAFEEYLPIYQHLTQDGIMQFTGLRDKNGKEIYEGDVVRFIDVGVIGSQHYKNEGEPKGVVRWSDFGAFYLDDGDEGPFMHSMTEFEVIGNVYENPELLEVGN